MHVALSRTRADVAPKAVVAGAAVLITAWLWATHMTFLARDVITPIFLCVVLIADGKPMLGAFALGNYPNA